MIRGRIHLTDREVESDEVNVGDWPAKRSGQGWIDKKDAAIRVVVEDINAFLEETPSLAKKAEQVSMAELEATANGIK